MPEPDLATATAGAGPVLPAAEGSVLGAVATAAPVASARRRRLTVPGWLAVGWLGLIVALSVLAPVLPLDDPDDNIASIARQGPGTDGHVFGGDGLGRDLLSRIVWGGRASLLLGVASVTIGVVVGGLLGLLAGYRRGRFDTVLTGVFDVLLSFPQLVLAVTLVTVWATGEGTSATRRMVVLILALGVVSIPLLARISRATTLSWSQREFVQAAKAVGARDSSIMFREVLPNVLPAMFSIALLSIAVVIVAEGGLSLLGVGVQLPTPSWGNIIAEGRGDLRDAPHVVLVPTVVIFLTVLALNYLGDVVRSWSDVRSSAL